jgi:hypothetical protein
MEQRRGADMLTLNFSRKVLGAEAFLKLERYEVTQTIRAGTSDIVKGIMDSELRAGDELCVALDGENIGLASLIACHWVPATALTSEDARRGGFNTVDELKAALKRAGYRFKPLIDYVFYLVQFGWR